MRFLAMGHLDQPTPQAIGLGNVYEKTLSILGDDLKSLPTEIGSVEHPQSSHSDIEVIDL